MRQLRKYLCFILCLALSFSIVVTIPFETASAAKKVTIKVNGKKKAASPAPKLVSGKVYASAKAMAKALGAKYSYKSKSKLITIKKGKTTIKYTIGKKKVTVSGKKVTTSAAKLYSKKPYVMVKFLATKLGYTYSYKSSTRVVTIKTKAAPTPTPTLKPMVTPDPNEWVLKYSETFDENFSEPSTWTEDKYTTQDDEFFGEDGFAFKSKTEYWKNRDYEWDTSLTVDTFSDRLSTFRSFRKSYTYGENNWLTVELYGRDNDKNGTPESGGKFTVQNGKAHLTSSVYTDAGLIRSTRALPDNYIIEVKVSNINYGGKESGSTKWNKNKNGYNSSSSLDAGPWSFWRKANSPNDARAENGVYFLAISDYTNPKPHNNVFIHHHRKVAMDADNNIEDWSRIWYPKYSSFIDDGDRYVSMLWLNGDSFGSDDSGNGFISYAGGGLQAGADFTDKYIDSETYTFRVERTPEYYQLSVSGKFALGGNKTYTYKKYNVDYENGSTWHFNQTPAELGSYTPNNEKRYYTHKGTTKSFDAWPSESYYPDYFFFGDPHINYYAGSCDYDDVKLYIKADSDWE